MCQTEALNQQHQRQIECRQYQHQHQQYIMRAYQQILWSWTQNGSMGTEQNLKTSEGESVYSSRATEQLQPIKELQQCQLDLEGVQQEFTHRRRSMNYKTPMTPRAGKNLSKKSKQCLVTRAKQQMQNGKQKHIVDFIIEFKVLAMKVDTDNLHTIFLLKKNVQHDIIKMIFVVATTYYKG